MSNKAGFTLIEILIALSIFAILATITTSTLYYAFTSRARMTEHAERLTNLQLMVSLITRDTTQVVERPIRSTDMRQYPAFVGQKKYVELTRNGMANPQSLEKRSTLKRVGLVCQGSLLLRRSWDALDPINIEKYEDKILLDNLEKCQFNYLNQNLQVLPEWHASALTQNQNGETMPKAIQLVITLSDWGNTVFLFPLPRAIYANNKQ